MLKKSKDPYLALMSYRSTPLECGLSPAELLMERKIRTAVPISPKMLTPQWPYLDQFLEADQHIKNRQKNNFDKRHNARDLPVLGVGEKVWIIVHKSEGMVMEKTASSRSYLVQTPSGPLRRNRRHLSHITKQADSPESRDIGPGTQEPAVNPEPSSLQPSVQEPAAQANPDCSAKTRSGRLVKTPLRFRD